MLSRAKKRSRGFAESRPPAYTYAGPARYESHRGNRPMEIVWELEHALLPEVLEVARVAG